MWSAKRMDGCVKKGGWLASEVLGPSYTDTFSNLSVFISLRFQIDPLWIVYSNVCVFLIVFIVSV